MRKKNDRSIFCYNFVHKGSQDVHFEPNHIKRISIEKLKMNRSISKLLQLMNTKAECESFLDITENKIQMKSNEVKNLILIKFNLIYKI